MHGKLEPKTDIAMNFESIPSEYSFLEKSPPKENPSIDGILKLNWAYKHCHLIPSLVIYTSDFCTDWSASDWIRRETAIIDKINQLKHFMSQRDVKIILTLMKFGSNSVDKDVIEERLNSLKKHCQLDGKNFIILSQKDLTSGTKDSIKRMLRTIRDHSAAYYISQGR